MTESQPEKETQLVEIYVFHDCSLEGIVAEFGMILEESELQWSSGTKIAPAHIIFCLTPMTFEENADALANGAVLVPGYADGHWAVGQATRVRLEQLAAALVNLLSACAPTRVQAPEFLEESCDAIDGILLPNDDDTLLDALCSAMSLAHERSVGLETVGATHQANALLLHCSRAISRCAEDRDASEVEVPLVEFLIDELGETMAEARLLRPDNVPGANETIRETFNRFLLTKHTTDALFTVNELFEDLASSGRSLNASLIYDILTVAISEGTPIYNAGSHLGCAQIYLCDAHAELDGAAV